jgi:hypothetical protein
MSFISPALISRIYQALGRNKGSHAILLLRQHQFESQPTHDKELMPLVVRMADQCLVDTDLQRAEDHYKLGLALYTTCFCENAVDALRCVSGLISIYSCQGRNAELSDALILLDEVAKAVRMHSGDLKLVV